MRNERNLHHPLRLDIRMAMIGASGFERRDYIRVRMNWL